MSSIFVKMLFFISVSCCWFAGQNSAAPSRTTGRMLNTSVRQPSAGFEDSQTEGNKTKTCIVRKSKSLSQTSTCSVVKELCLIFFQSVFINSFTCNFTKWIMKLHRKKNFKKIHLWTNLQGKRKAKSTTDDRNSLEYTETQQMSMEN